MHSIGVLEFTGVSEFITDCTQILSVLLHPGFHARSEAAEDAVDLFPLSRVEINAIEEDSNSAGTPAVSATLATTTVTVSARILAELATTASLLPELTSWSTTLRAEGFAASTTTLI